MDMKRQMEQVNGKEAHELLVDVANQVDGNPIPLLLLTTVLAYFYGATTWADVSKVETEDYRKIITKITEDASFVIATAMEEALRPYARVRTSEQPLDSSGPIPRSN